MDKDSIIKENYKNIVGMVQYFKNLCDLSDDMAEDLLKDGYVSILEQLEKYDESRDVPFWSYAKARVHGAMIKSIQRMITTCDISDHMNRQFIKISRIIKQKPDISTNELIAETANVLNVSEKKAYELVTLHPRGKVLMSDIDNANTPISERTRSAALDKKSNPEDIILEITDEDTMKQINKILDTVLSPRHAEYIRLHYGIGCLPLSFADIAEEYCVTESTVQKAIKTAINKIKENV